VHEIKHDGYRLQVHREARPFACSPDAATTERAAPAIVVPAVLLRAGRFRSMAKPWCTAGRRRDLRRHSKPSATSVVSIRERPLIRLQGHVP
jgi:hypothetical protein